MTTSFRDLIAENTGKFPVTRAMFEASRETLSESGSWAIWHDESGGLDHFSAEKEPWRRLRRDVVILGGNSGIPSSSAPTPQPFSNFHTKGHTGDGKLRNGVRNTPLAGSYMTDVIKGVPTAYSRKDPKTGSLGILDMMGAGDVDLQAAFVDPLIREFEVLALPRDVMFFLCGPGTHAVWNFAVEHADVPAGLLDAVRVARVRYHYTYTGDPKRGRPSNYDHYLNEALDESI